MLDNTELSQPLCRVCFCGTEPTLKASGHLISPCSCTGSVRYIHLHCLRTWQATQRSQGRVSRSQCCELCGCKYSIPKNVLQQEVEQSTYLEKIQLGLKCVWLWFNDTAQGPMWQEALRYWRNALLIAGLYKATLWGLVGLVAGGQIGINSASRGAYCLVRLTPGFMMAAMLFPRLQAPLMMGSILSLAGLAAGATALTMAGAYCGAFYGFCSGTLGFLRWALITHFDTAAVGYKCTELTISAAFKIATNLGSRLAVFLRKTGSLL